MFPLRDENPTRSTPVVTIVLIVLNVVAFIYQHVLGMHVSVQQLGLIPIELTQGVDYRYVGVPGLPRNVAVHNLNPAWMTIFTSMFLHGGWLHILGNMWFLWIFGNNVEDVMGKTKYLLFYLASGVAAAGLQILTNTRSDIPMIGASGAVAGVLGAYLVLFPGSRVLCLVTMIIITTIEVPAWIVLGMWFVIELARGALSLGVERSGGVAYAAHVGGFVFGLLLGRLLARVTPPHSARRSPPGDYDWR